MTAFTKNVWDFSALNLNDAQQRKLLSKLISVLSRGYLESTMRQLNIRNRSVFYRETAAIHRYNLYSSLVKTNPNPNTFYAQNIVVPKLSEDDILDSLMSQSSVYDWLHLALEDIHLDYLMRLITNTLLISNFDGFHLTYTSKPKFQSKLIK